MSKLKEILFEGYGGFADKRIKHMSSGSVFLADDRTQGDLGSDKKPFGWFCTIFVEIISEQSVRVTLGGQIPNSPGVQECFRLINAEIRNNAPSVRFIISPDNFEFLNYLAMEFKNIVALGRRYDTPSYKYSCPRTAQSLQKLSTLLQQAWAA